jgi:hypothetical protein
MSEHREMVDDPMSADCSPRLRVAGEYDLDDLRLDGARELRGVESPFWVDRRPAQRSGDTGGP